MEMNRHQVGALTLIVLQTGCSSWVQKPDTVLIREHDQSGYTIHYDVETVAKNYWVYTALAANAYHLKWPDYKQQLVQANIKQVTEPLSKQFERSCKPHSDVTIPTPGWYAWTQFPGPNLAKKAEKAKLFFSVWEHRTGKGSSDVSEVAIVFRGTEGDQRQDWESNARWFIPTKLRGEDQYDITRDIVARVFEDEIQTRIRQHRLPPDVKVVALGHSLGGGLAQQLAYAMPRSSEHLIKVSKVVAFNSSPVTGWLSTQNPPRDENTHGLEIDRVFEHGEALAYVRLVINMIVPPQKRDSHVRDLRFNFLTSAGGVSNHGSQFFACRFAEVAGATKDVVYTESFADQAVPLISPPAP
jgi:pimeloyl-ACP methyl ester carboxylesterase